MEYKIGDKIRFKCKLTYYGLLRAKKGQIGEIVDIREKNVVAVNCDETETVIDVKLSNGVVVDVEGEKIGWCLEPYKKVEKITIKNSTNEQLLENFHRAVSSECFANSTKSKSYQKLLKDIEEMRKEILNRMK